MAVAIDAVNTADGHTTGVSVTTLTNANLTVGSGANRVLWAAMSFVVAGGSAPASRTMTWDAAGANQAMTEVLFVANGTNGWISIFGLIAPTAGNKTLTCSWTNNNGGYLSCASFTGANQTSVAAAFTNTASATGTASPASVAVTSAVGNICAYAFQATSAGDLAVLDATTISAPDAVDANGSGAANYKTGAASVTSNCTLSPTPGVWLAAGCQIVASGGTAFQWYPMNFPGFTELPIIRPILDIIGY